MTPYEYALEVKRSRTFRGQRMSAAQRRQAAIGQRGREASFDPALTGRSERLGGYVSRNGQRMGGGAVVFRKPGDQFHLDRAYMMEHFPSAVSVPRSQRAAADARVRANAEAWRRSRDGEANLGGPAKRSTGRAARGRRLTAAGSFAGVNKDAQRRIGQIQRARADYVGARSRVRSFISANRRG